MSYRKRVDANHAAIREALRKAGWTVEDTSRVGGGFADLLIGKHGRLLMVEVKDGTKPPSARKLTPDEQAFAERWKAAGVPVVVIENIEQALALRVDYVPAHTRVVTLAKPNPRSIDC